MGVYIYIYILHFDFKTGYTYLFNDHNNIANIKQITILLNDTKNIILLRANLF